MPSSDGGEAARKALEKERWERDWTIEAARPEHELSTAVPSELGEAIEAGWLKPGGRVLDVGCGRGQVAAWLVERGFSAVGVDLAQAAVDLARRHYASLGPRIEFRVVDVCEDAAEPAAYDAVIDRNCFHNLEPDMQRRYAAYVAASAKPGATFYLFHKLVRGTTRAEVVARVLATFGADFGQLQSKGAAEPLSRSAGAYPRWRQPGIALRMLRAAPGVKDPSAAR